jgi:hypothetical protein
MLLTENIFTLRLTFWATRDRSLLAVPKALQSWVGELGVRFLAWEVVPQIIW